MAAYTRQSSFSDGDTISASLFNNEYDALAAAFVNTSGHKHDGTTGEGPVIGVLGDASVAVPLNKILIDSSNDHLEFYVDVSSSSVQQLYIADGLIAPVTDSDVDLGTSSLYFKNAYIDSITTTGNVAVGGNLTVTGTTTFNGGTLTLGDADTDNIVFGGEVDSNIIPDDDGTHDLGSSTKEWKDIYIDGVAYLDEINFNGTAITSTAAELNILDGVTATASELNYSDTGAAVGTVVASKVVTVDSNKDASSFRNVTLTGELSAATLDISSDVDIDGTSNLDDTDIDGTLVVDGSNISLDSTSTLNIDNSNTSNGITIGTATSGVPISIGHTTSETTINDNLTVTGDLTVSGTTTTVSSTTVEVADAMLKLAKDQGTSADAVDFGFYGQYGVGGTAKYAGVFRDQSVAGDPFTFFDDLQAEPGTTVNTGGTGYDLADIAAGGATFADDVVITGDLTVSGDDITMGTNTAGHVMVADGANFNPVAISGDVTIASSGAVTIASGAVETAMLNANVVSGQTAITSSDVNSSDDSLLLHDNDAGALKKVTVANLISSAGGLTDVIADTTPQLGGNLDTNSHNILIDDAHFIGDENGNEQIIFQTTSSAVNQIDVTNAATGNSPEISATGDDTNISLKLTPKGSGQVLLDGNVGIESGTIDLKNSGSRSKINFYCESGNAHAQALQAAPHSAAASNTLTLPSTGGDVDLVSTASTATLTNKSIDSDNNTITNIVNADIKASAGIVDTKLATISTAGKVDIGALEIDGATEMSAALVDADLFIVDDGANGTEKSMLASRIKTYVGAEAGAFSIDNLDIDGGTDIGEALVDADLLVVDNGAGGTNRKMEASRLQTYIEGKISGDITISSGTAAIGSGVIVNDDINSSAAIADSKLATISTADKVSGAAIQVDGATDGTGITIADSDKLIVDDAGATKYVNASQLKTYASADSASAGFAVAMAIAL